MWNHCSRYIPFLGGGHKFYLQVREGARGKDSPPTLLPRSVHPSAGGRKPKELLDSGSLGGGQVVVIGILALEQAAVGGDLLLQLCHWCPWIAGTPCSAPDVSTNITWWLPNPRRRRPCTWAWKLGSTARSRFWMSIYLAKKTLENSPHILKNICKYSKFPLHCRIPLPLLLSPLTFFSKLTTKAP